jgi:hypothetical protein
MRLPHIITPAEITELHEMTFLVLIASSSSITQLKRIWAMIRNDTLIYNVNLSGIHVSEHTTLSAAIEAYNEL